jgi:hypothetical protein
VAWWLTVLARQLVRCCGLVLDAAPELPLHFPAFEHCCFGLVVLIILHLWDPNLFLLAALFTGWAPDLFFTGPGKHFDFGSKWYFGTGI